LARNSDELMRGQILKQLLYVVDIILLLEALLKFNTLIIHLNVDIDLLEIVKLLHTHGNSKYK